MRPNASRHASIIALTEALGVTSHSCALMVPPNSATRSSVSFIDSPFLSTAKTLAPSRANSTAVARPLPQPGPMQPAPVTRATLSCRRPGIGLLRTFEAEPLDQSAPFRAFVLHVGVDAVDRRRVDRDQANVGDLGLHLGVVHDLLHLGVQAIDNVL